MLLDAGMGHSQLAAVQHIVTDETVQEGPDLFPELLWLGQQLLLGLLQAVGALDVLAEQQLDELHVVVARDAEGVSGVDHIHDQLQRVDVPGTAVAEVAQEDGLAAFRMLPDPGVVGYVAQLCQQLGQLVEAAVDVADDVEGAVLFPLVVPHLRADDLSRVHLVHAVQHVNKAEALLLETVDAAPKVVGMPADHMLRELPLRAGGVALLQDRFGNVEHDGHAVAVLLLCQVQDLLTGNLLQMGGVDDGQLHGVQALFCDVVQGVKGRGGAFLVVLIVGDQPPEEIGGKDLGGLEVLRREAGLAAGGGPHQGDQAEFRYLYPHFENTPICVGCCPSSSVSPIQDRRTV